MRELTSTETGHFIKAKREKHPVLEKSGLECTWGWGFIWLRREFATVAVGEGEDFAAGGKWN